MSRRLKDSKQEYIGKIPVEWDIIKLCYITNDIFLGKTPVYSETPNENYIIGQKNNQSTGIDLNGVKYGTDAFFFERSDKEYLKIGDVLLNTLGTGSVGRIGYWNINDGSYITDGHIMIFRPNNNCYGRFLYYALVSQHKKLEDDAVGSTNQAFLTVSQLYKNKIAITDYKEQIKISNFLDEKCNQIDNIISKTQASIEEYKKLKQSIITQAVTKGVRGDREMKDSGSIWFGYIPSEWEMRKIKYQFHIKKDIAGKEGYTILSITQKGIIPKDISKNEGQLAANYSNYQLVAPGDFAMNHMDLLTGWVDISKYSGVTSPDYRVFVLDDKVNNSSEFYLYMMQMCYSNRIFYGLGQGVSGLGRWRLQADKFLNFMIPVPSYDEQKEIADYIVAKTSELDNLISKKEAFINEIEAYKKSLIYEYVTGKKEVV